MKRSPAEDIAKGVTTEGVTTGDVTTGDIPAKELPAKNLSPKNLGAKGPGFDQGFGHPDMHPAASRAALTAMVAVLGLSTSLIVVMTALSIRVAAAMALG